MRISESRISAILRRPKPDSKTEPTQVVVRAPRIGCYSFTDVKRLSDDIMGILRKDGFRCAPYAPNLLRSNLCGMFWVILIVRTDKGISPVQVKRRNKMEQNEGAKVIAVSTLPEFEQWYSTVKQQQHANAQP